MLDTATLNEYFQWFHQHPELSYQEVETTAKIKEILTFHGVSILETTLDTGLIAYIKGNNNGKRIGFRVDIDGLPIQEKSGLSYASLIEGKSHACGHDLHIVTGVAVAIGLHEIKDQLNGEYYIIFQPAEETSVGAKVILDTHLVDQCDVFFGLHADPTNPVGILGISEGAVAAAVDRFNITIEGVGCHGAHPDDGIDPISAAISLASGLNTIVSRNCNAFRPALLSITKICSGNTWNVVPTTASIEGTFRTLDKCDREMMNQRIVTLSHGIAQAYQCNVNVDIISGADAVINDGLLVSYSKQIASKCNLKVVDEEKSMGGDDFSYYGSIAPSIYIKVGSGVGPTIHQSDFCIDPSVLSLCANYFIELLSHFKDVD